MYLSAELSADGVHMGKGCTETEHPRMDSLRDEQVRLFSFTRSSVAGFLYALSVGAV